MDISTVGFDFGGKRVTPNSYGSSYINEFCRVISSFNKFPPKKILEWGSGLTTQILSKYVEEWSSKLLLSIDDNRNYQNAIFAKQTMPRYVQLRAIDRIGPCLNQTDVGFNYSSFPLSIPDKFDLIFIDGRRRMECAFISALKCTHDAIVIIHDYRRSRYQPIRALFDIIEDGEQFRVMRPRIQIHNAMTEISKTLQGELVNVGA